MMARTEARVGRWSLDILGSDGVVTRSLWWSSRLEDLIYEHVDALTVVDRVRQSRSFWVYIILGAVVWIGFNIAMEGVWEPAKSMVKVLWLALLIFVPLPSTHAVVVFREDAMGSDEFWSSYDGIEMLCVKRERFGHSYLVTLIHKEHPPLFLKLAPWAFASFYASLHWHFLKHTGRSLDEIRHAPEVLYQQFRHGKDSPSVLGMQQGLRDTAPKSQHSTVLWWFFGVSVVILALVMLVMDKQQRDEEAGEIENVKMAELQACKSYVGQAPRSLNLFSGTQAQPLPRGLLVHGKARCVLYVNSGVVSKAEFCGASSLEGSKTCQKGFEDLLKKVRGD